MAAHSKIDASTWRDRIRSSGLRVTPGRVAALEFLHEHPHSSAVELHAGIAKVLPSITLQSAHNIVHDLSDRGIIRRVDLPDSTSARYETRVDENHHHVQCIRCGRIDDIDAPPDGVDFLEPRMHNGIQILAAEVTFKGICVDCESESESENAPESREATPSTEPTDPSTTSTRR